MNGNRRTLAAVVLAFAAGGAGACAAAPGSFVLNLTLPIEYECRPSEPLPLVSHVRPSRAESLNFALASDSDAARPAFAFDPKDNAASGLFRFAGAEGTTQTVTIRAKDVTLDPGTLDVAAAMGQQSVADDITVERLLAPGVFEAESTSTLYAGARALWFKQLSFAVAAAVSETRASANPAFRNVDPGAFSRAQTAGAVWFSARADFGKANDLKWTIVTQFGEVAEGFRTAGAARSRPEGAVPIIGERAYAMTRVAIDDIALSAAAQSLRNDDYEMASRRATISPGWGAFSLFTRDFVRIGRRQETNAIGIAGEIYADQLFSFADRLAPTLISVDWRRQDESGDAIDASRRSVIAVDGVWVTDIGETMLSYWQSAPGTTRSTDSLIDVSHRATWGDWRVRGGLTQMEFHTSATTDRGVVAYGSLAFAPERWFNIELGIEHKKDEMLEALGEETFALEGLDLRLAIDAAPLLRAAFDMEAVTAILEYRQTVDRYGLAADADRSDATAVAATLAAPL